MDLTFFENQPFFTKNLSKKDSEDRNIWVAIAPIFALLLEFEQPQTLVHELE